MGQREIKYRVWDIDKQKFYYLDLRRDYQFARHLYHYGNDVSWNEEEDPIINFNPNHPISEYTGLKDKNGKEIFEGDVVKYKDFSNGALFALSGEDIQPRATFVIEIDNLFQGIHLRGFGINSPNKVKEKLEVIGNIHQHPHLLEGGER